MTIHDRDKLLITKDVIVQYSYILRKGQIVFARGTSSSSYGKIDNLPILFRTDKGMLAMAEISADAYELIELKYIPLYRLLYE